MVRSNWPCTQLLKVVNSKADISFDGLDKLLSISPEPQDLVTEYFKILFPKVVRYLVRKSNKDNHFSFLFQGTISG